MAERDCHRMVGVGHAMDRAVEAIADAMNGISDQVSAQFSPVTRGLAYQELRWARASVMKAARHLLAEICEAQREVAEQLLREELALANGPEGDSEEGAAAG